MSEWINLNPELLNKSQHRQINGVEIVVGLSPYDIPDGVRGFYNDEINRFVIEFRYLDGEEERESYPQGDHLTLLIGTHSQRLYAIQLDTDDLGANKVQLNILLPGVSSALTNLGKQHRFKDMVRHYEVAKEVISDNADELMVGV